MSFNLDDPLGDLLSDGSNDSFFGETTNKKATTTDKKDTNLTGRGTSTPKTDTKSKMDELFGIKNEDKQHDLFSTSSSRPTDFIKTDSKADTTSGPSSLGTPRVPSTPQMKRVDSAPKVATSGSSLVKSQTFDKDDDILSDLGFDPKIKPSRSSKASILDDLLEISEQPKAVVRPKTSSSTVPLPAKEDFGLRPKTSSTVVDKFDEAPITQKSILTSKQPASEILGTSESNLSGYTPSTRRVSRRGSSTILNDPLGLFSKPEDETSAKKPETKGTEESKIISGQSNQIFTAPTPAPRQEQLVASPMPSILSSSNVFQATSVSDFNTKAQMLAISATETEHAISALKQQEVQLAVAAQMKSQESALVDMQQRQEQLLRQQEYQFNDLLQKQLQRQLILEESIKKQQDRINAHIHLLMTQPAGAYETSGSNFENKPVKKLNIQEPTDDSSSSDDGHKTDIDYKSEIKQLELEKLRLEDLLSNISANHENEITHMENSYKKQIKLLEETLQKIEERLRTDNKNLQDYYFGKIGDLENEKQHLIEDSKLKLKLTREEYDQSVQDIKKKYNEELEAMERNYKDMIQNIRQSKLLEFSLVQENGNYLETLRSASQLLENANQGFDTLTDELHKKIDKVYHERESQLRIRETKVEQHEKLMEKQMENCEEEKKQLLDLVKNLEIKLNSVEQISKEENWQWKQKSASLEVERAAFEREKTFMREQTTREQKTLEEQKHQQVLEYDRLMKQIEEERMNLITEKAKMETSQRLQKRSDQNISRAEIEAALKVAEEAGRQADNERERLLDAQRQYETKRRQLTSNEQNLKTKEIELEEAMSVLNIKEKQAENALKNAKSLERNILIKLQLLQKHSSELKDRESKLSLEKLNLSKERMQLETQRTKMLDNRCSLCKIGAKTAEITSVLRDSESTTLVTNNRHEYDLLNKDEIDNDLDISMNTLRQHSHINMQDDIDIDLNGIPNLTDMSDNLLNDDLLLLKFDILHSNSSDYYGTRLRKN